MPSADRSSRTDRAVETITVPALASRSAAEAEKSSRDEARRLSSLLEISQALSGTLQLKSGLHKALEILGRHHDLLRGYITLEHEDGERHVEAYDSVVLDGLRPATGAGSLTGRVIDSGRPVMLEKIGADELVGSKRTHGSGPAVTFMGLPILLSRRAIGALSVELAYRPERDFDRTGKFYGVVASMIAQAIKVQRLIEHDRQQLEKENEHLRRELRDRYDFSNIIGASVAVRAMYEQVAQVASTSTTVLIRGESGTGKELIAHAIHYNSLRAKKPFIKVSCAALPETLIESELFGHERGAFTDAKGLKKGRFELAEGGTLFLDEIGDVNSSTQIKLLRVLQQREFERLGGTDTIKANVRIVAATNKDLERAIAAGEFREDLYYRLNVFSIVVPPLRERKADLPLLVDHFLAKLSRDHHKDVRRIAAPALDALLSYHWPGNVRELENVLERAVLVCDGQVVHAHHLPPTLQTAETSGEATRVSLAEAVDAYERDLIQDAIKTSRGNRAKAARLLSTTERILNRRVSTLNIDFQRFKDAR